MMVQSGARTFIKNFIVFLLHRHHRHAVNPRAKFADRHECERSTLKIDLGITRTGHELPNFTVRSQRQTFAI